MLFNYRANGSYSLAEYRRFFANRSIGWWRIVLITIAVFPGRLANIIAVGYVGAKSADNATAVLYNLLSCSRFSNGLSRRLASAFGH